MVSYCGSPPVPLEILTRWNFDPWLIGSLLLLLGASRYVSHPGRFAGGVAVLAVLFVSPLCALTVALFSARTLHHLGLMALAAPLLAGGWGPLRLGQGGAAAGLAASLGLLWFWHLPAAYDASLSSTPAYWLMQGSLLASAVLFWRLVFGSSTLAALGLLAGAAGAMGMLAAVLTFAPVPLYLSHLSTTLPWGLEPLADQQLGGLLMWTGGLLPYALAAFLVARRGWTGLAAGTAAP